jgi:hypothetical protein
MNYKLGDRVFYNCVMPPFRFTGFGYIETARNNEYKVCCIYSNDYCWCKEHEIKKIEILGELD